MASVGEPSLITRTDNSEGQAARVVLLATEDRLLRSLGTVLRDAGYRLLICRRAELLPASLESGTADAMLVDLELPLEMREGVGRRLRELGGTPRFPVIGLCRTTALGEARLSALKAGFWDVIPFPGASLELLSKLATFTSVKRQVDGLRSGLMLDTETGHYSSLGLRRKLRELTSLMHRTEDALACVMFGADDNPALAATSDEAMEAGRRFSLLLHHGTRNSDVIGRLDPLRFVVLAPHTPVAGAIRMAERFTSASLSRHVDGELSLTFSAGVVGIECRNGQVEARPELLLAAAERAFHRARDGGVAQVASVWGPPDGKE